MRNRKWAALRHLLFWPLSCVALYLVAAVFGAVIPGKAASLTPANGPPVEVGLIAGPIHYDFILPATLETRRALGFASHGGVPVKAPWVEHFLVGWGSAGFYTTAGTYFDVTLPTVWTAATGDGAVLRIETVGTIREGFSYPKRTLTAAEYTALLAFITKAKNGPPIIGAGFTNTDAFFPAEGRFHLLRTCNTWITDALRAAGQRAGAWTPLPFSVTLSLWWFA